IARFSYTQSWISVRPSACVATGTKNGRLSILIPGYGRGAIFSGGAVSLEGNNVTSANTVRPLSAVYLVPYSYFWLICPSVTSSNSRKSIGQRFMVSSELVVAASEMKNIDSIGSSLGYTTTSLSMSSTPCTTSVEVPMPSTFTPHTSRNMQRSCTI